MEGTDLMHKLKDVAPDIQNLEQELVLRTVGKICRKTLTRRRKQSVCYCLYRLYNIFQLFFEHHYIFQTGS